jgi:hypothetical protein
MWVKIMLTIANKMSVLKREQSPPPPKKNQALGFEFHSETTIPF